MSSSLAAADRTPDDVVNTSSCAAVNLLLDAFRRHADRIALIDANGAITYGQVLDKLAQLARALESRGVRRGDGIAAIDDNTPGILLSYLVAKVLGCYFLALPAKAAPAEQVRILEFTGVSALVYEPSWSGERVAELAGRGVSLDFFALGPDPIGTDLLALAAEQSPAPFPVRAKDDDVADIVLTGGSSGGQPKAAAYTFERVAELLTSWLAITSTETQEAAAYRAPDCRMLRTVRATASPGIAVFPTLLNGGVLLLQEVFDADATLRAIAEHRVTVLALYPSHLYQLLDHPDVTTIDRSSVRLVVYWGTPMSPTRLKQAIAVFGPVFSQTYGQTETRMVCGLHPEDHRLDRTELLRSVGRPRPGVELEIRTGDAVAAPGEIGEICVRSAYRMNGFWRDPELTEKAIVDGWSRTGDLAYQDAEGYVYLADRLRDMVLVNAVNCYTVDIENVLTAHPAVREAVVVGLPDARTGEAVHVAVVAVPGHEVSEAELREHVRTELGEYEAPSSVLFIDEVPVTRSGKPNKNAVRELLAERQRADGLSGP